MKNTMSSILHPGAASVADPDFPCAPVDWSQAEGLHKAADEGITLTDEHWNIIDALQDYFSKHGSNEISARDVHDALDEKFHAQGGLKHLYMLFPGGPIAQGCRIAGLEPPAGSSNPGFGSVQ